MTRFRILLVAAVVALVATTGCAPTQENYGPLKTRGATNTKTLADERGMTLYTFDKDEPGKSNCYGECAEYWPPALAPSDAKPLLDLAPIERADGTLQWAHRGKPLYTYVEDQEPGDITGDGKDGVWHVVKTRALPGWVSTCAPGTLECGP
jgi:predicted lipoprotein with Yx(FWY)xxD motif